MMAKSHLAFAVTLFLFLAVLPKSTLGQGVVQGSGHGPEKDCSKGCRSDGVNVNISLNLAKDKTITFTSPSGDTVTYERTNEPKSSAKNGSSDSEDWHGTAGFRAANIIVRKSDDGQDIFTASFVIPNHTCTLKYVYGEYDISCRHKSTYPPKMAPRLMYDAPPHKSKRTNKKSIFTEQATSTLGTMVVWTKKAECALSYQPEDCQVDSDTKRTMTDLIALAISETNTAYAESGINAILELVHAYREPNYVEGEDDAMITALDDITNDGDGVMDDVHTEREKYGADIVVLLIEDYSYCGVAWIGPYKEIMFSVTAQSCATGDYVFGHEIGHNMGCNHDRGTDSMCGYDGYAYGWRDPDGEFGTIMSYGCSSGECDNNPSDYCGIVQRFSSASLKFDGKALGDNSNDCARQHNDVRAEVAEYTVTVTNPTPPTASDPPTPSPIIDCNGILLTVDLTCDNFPSETSWTVTSKSNGNIVLENGALSEGQTYTTSTCLTRNSGCFSFKISDSQNDGICCTFGQGSFSVTFDSEVILEGDEFGSSADVDFCTSDSTPIGSPSELPDALPITSPIESPSELPDALPIGSPIGSPSGSPHAPSISPVVPTNVPNVSPVTLAPVKFQCNKSKECNDNDVCTVDKCKKKKGKCTNKKKKNKCCTKDAECVNTFRKNKCKVYECNTRKERCKKIETLKNCKNKNQCKNGTCGN